MKLLAAAVLLLLMFLQLEATSKGLGAAAAQEGPLARVGAHVAGQARCFIARLVLLVKNLHLNCAVALQKY